VPDAGIDSEEREVVDVVVIGGGLAGHCAAIAAAEAGASVLLAEKLGQVGGSTVLSGGFLAFAGTEEQRRRGIEDDDAQLLADLRAVGGEDADDALLREYVAQQADAYRWLRGVGIAFGGVEQSAGQRVARSHESNIRGVIETLNARLRALPRCELRLGTRARKLLREEVGGPVRALDVETPEGPLQVRVAGGVVIASGGFSRSEAMLRLFAPGQAKAMRIGGAGNTGDGLRMAWMLGAGMRDMGRVRGTFGNHPTGTDQKHELLLSYYQGAIIVNKLARRFVDESESYKLLGEACLAQPDQRAWQVFDQGVMERSDPGVAIFDLKVPLERGLLIAADTVEALAGKCGLDAVALRQTIDRYNEGVDRGVDPDYGRDGLCAHAGVRPRLDRAPYYAYPSTTVVLATYCGLHADERARVRDVEGAIIAGLYAAGEVVGGFHGQSYMTGTSLGKAAIFGRIAGREAAQRARDADGYDRRG
jgi:fumarate reductase flavoprotein subunit